MLTKEKLIFRVRIPNVYEINISADELVRKLLKLSETQNVCILDSCGVKHLDSQFLIAGINPLEVLEIEENKLEKSLSTFNEKLSENFTTFFTISYDFGLKLENLQQRKKEKTKFSEPDIFLATFDLIIIHDYQKQQTFFKGNKEKFEKFEKLLSQTPFFTPQKENENINKSQISSNFSKKEYLSKIKQIQELIRKGDTYQTNLTQQFCVELPKPLTPQQIFWNLRKNHPAPFASFFKRNKDYVVSISPERFFEIKDINKNSRQIRTSPIKGTRPRGKNKKKDLILKKELLSSEKDLAENTMIVDLLRNDIGRVCDYGSIRVEKLCGLEKHPSLFHLVSTVSGTLRKNVNYGDIIKAIFPCGSITGCPKIRTMQIIDELETSNRGLSMGTIGYSAPRLKPKKKNRTKVPIPSFHSSVAIRTMVIRNEEAIFNVGGGIVIDSKPEDEYEESLLKAKALFAAIGIKKF